MCILYHKTETIISAIHPTAYAVGFLASVSVKKAAARFSGHVPSRPVCSGRMRDFTHRGLSRNSGAGMSGGGACAKTPGGNGALLRLNCRTLFPSCARPNSFSPLFRSGSYGSLVPDGLVCLPRAPGHAIMVLSKRMVNLSPLCYTNKNHPPRPLLAYGKGTTAALAVNFGCAMRQGAKAGGCTRLLWVHGCSFAEVPGIAGIHG